MSQHPSKSGVGDPSRERSELPFFVNFRLPLSSDNSTQTCFSAQSCGTLAARRARRTSTILSRRSPVQESPSGNCTYGSCCTPAARSRSAAAGSASASTYRAGTPAIVRARIVFSHAGQLSRSHTMMVSPICTDSLCRRRLSADAPASADTCRPARDGESANGRPWPHSEGIAKRP